MPSLLRHVGTIAVAGFLVTPAIAQCTLAWQPGPAVPGPAGIVRALVELPNGDLLAGGTFTYADASRVDHLATWSGGKWLPFQGGTDGDVNAIVMLPNGDIVVGGNFQTAGGTSAANLARFDGIAWHAFGAGADAQVLALRVMSDGDLIVGGSFSTLDALPASRIGRWNSGGFKPLGGGVDGAMSPTYVAALAGMPNGDLAVGGLFTSVDGTFSVSVARWNGAVWTGVPAFPFVAFVTALAGLPNGDLIIGHDAGIVRWDGTAAQPLGGGVSGGVFALCRDGSGDLVVGGQFLQAGGVATSNVARWDGTSWYGYGTGREETTRSLLLRSNGTIVVGGGRSSSAMQMSRAVAAWSGASGTWTELGAPAPGADHASIRCMTRLPNGDVVVGGSFTAFQGIAMNRIAHWNGSTWSPLGAGLDGDVICATGAPNGDVIVGGSFISAGGIPAMHVARWNGVAWSAVGAGLPEIPRTIAAGDNVVYVSHYGATPSVSIVALSGGSSFTPIGSFNGGIQAMIAVDDLPIIAGVLPGGNVQRWNGSWSAMGTLPGAIMLSLEVAPDGSLVVGGAGLGGTVRRWDGSSWLPVGSIGQVTGVTVLANGDLIAAGNAPYPDSLWRWSGASWQALGDGAATTMRIVGSGHGDLFVAGAFFACGGEVAAHFARMATPCPAAAVPFGVGCVGNAGLVELRVRHRPWIGSKFVADATGVPGQAWVVHAIGLQPTVAPLPLGGPGCAAFVDPISLDVLASTGNTTRVRLPIPDDSTLVGVGFVDQVAVLEIDAGGSWVRTTSSNALALRIGEL